MKLLRSVSDLANQCFVAFVLLATVLGWFRPDLFSWVGATITTITLFGSSVDLSFIHFGLGLIMFGMGMTLSIPNVISSLRNPHWILLGVLAQFLLMPLVAFLLSLGLGLKGVLAAGVILVGCCPGGTASNVIAFLSDADVPLSVSITFASTCLAPLTTPWLTWFYAQYLMGFFSKQVINVPVVGLMIATVVIVGPVVLGLLVKNWLHGEKPVPTLENLFTVFSILLISLLVAYIVGSRKESMVTHAKQAVFLFLPVMLHNGCGLALGYGTGRLFHLPLPAVRALSIEVGMQNSGLGLALAGVLATALNESAALNPELLALLPIPAVIFSFWHNLTGSMLASYWGSSAGSG